MMNKVWEWLMKTYGLFSVVLWLVWIAVCFLPFDNWWTYIGTVWGTQFLTRLYYHRYQDAFDNDF